MLPHPLAATSASFAAAWAGSIITRMPDGRRLGQAAGALEAYRAFHRDGLASALARIEPLTDAARAAVASWSTTLAPVLSTLREESTEGEVVKFLSQVPSTQSPTSAIATTATATPTATLAAESVLIPMENPKGERTYTLCLSSQIGCAMGCTFCETAQMGLLRSLQPHEIVAQWWNAAHVIGIRPKNIVFMGMGEPMDNLDHVLAAIDILRDHNGPHIAVSQITISTVGRVDGIEKLAEHCRQPGWHRLGLALSLNAPNDADRSAIMPVNRKWNLAALQTALIAWARGEGTKASGRKVCVEYVLIPGVNDTQAHADQIAAFIAPFGLCEAGKVRGTDLLAVLNLIPYNPRRNSPWPAPSEAQVSEFLDWLIARGVFVKRRRTKGRQMMGACGQLGSEHIRKRRVVGLTVGRTEGTEQT
jgi:23S rRNA (adenine2503-C2)-methyltransferase